MSTIRRFKYLIILILIPLLLTIIWFRNGLIVGGGEEGLEFYNPTRILELSKTMWWDYDGGFPTLAWLAKISSLLPTTFLYEKFNVPNYILQAGTFFILLVVGGISVYFLTLNLLDKFYLRKTVALVAAIFYILNPFSMSQIWARGLVSQYFSFALLPLAVLLFLKGLNGKILYLFYLTFASIIFSSAFGISTFVITYWVVLSATYVYWIFLNRKLTKKILYGSFFYVLSLILWFVTEAWWFLPTVVSGNRIYSGYLENYQENIGTLLGVSRNYTPEVIIRLLQRTYFFDPSAFSPIYSSFVFQLISLLIPIFLIIGLIVIFKRKELSEFKFFVLLFILGLLVSLGANPPLGWLFVIIFNHFPFLQSFRNPYEKFGLVYALGYTPLFALGVVYFFERKFQQKVVKFLGLLTVLILVCGIFAWPMWTGRVVTLPDRKIGIDVPKYYRDLNEWLASHNKDGYRIFMTPLWGGDGAFYNWDGTRYQGSDPMIYILDVPAVSASHRFPYFYDFMQSIRKYMDSKDVSDSLSLLRVKYLVAREDAYNISYAESMHEKYLTDAIFPPLGIDNVDRVVCTDKTSTAFENNPAWITCQLGGSEGDLTGIRYLYVLVRVDSPANLDLAIRDFKQARPRWYGKGENEYFLEANTWTKVVISLGAPSEINNDTDFSKIELIELQAHPINSPTLSVGKIELKGIWFDPGQEKKINNFKLGERFGKLNLYTPTNFNTPPEFGNLSSVKIAKNFPELFDLVKTMKDSLGSVGFIVGLQNSTKDTQMLLTEFRRQSLEKEKISNTRYWMKTDKEGEGLIILSKTFNPEWKVIPNINKADTAGGFINDLRLLQKSVLSEDNHFVVNGYANLWKVDDKEREYAIVFMPQIVADIGWKVSIFCIILLGGVTLVWVLKKYTFLR